MEADHLWINTEDLENTAGFAFDIGGSQAKIAYVDRNEQQKDGKRPVRFKLFSYDEIEDVIKFVKDKCPLNDSKTLEVNGTGFGSCTNKARFQKEFNIKLKVSGEFDCFSAAVAYRLKNYPLSEVFYPRNQDSENGALFVMKEWQDTFFAKLKLEDKKSSSKESEKSDDKEKTEKSDSKVSNNENKESETVKSETDKDDQKAEKPLDKKDEKKKKDMSSMRFNIADFPETTNNFPCILVVAGSGLAAYMVHEDGKNQILDGTFFAGRSLLGLANLTLGTNDYNEIISLAEKGDPTGVDAVKMDIMSEANVNEDELGEEARSYTSFPAKQPLYFMGKAAKSKGPFKKEDMAASLLNCLVTNITSLSFMVAARYGFKRIFFTGGLTRSPYARQLIEKSIISRIMMFQESKKEKVLYGFIRNGESYGALGALMKDL